jgi:hypothetical protein
VIPQARRLGRDPEKPIRVALANHTGLIYSDDYLDGWRWGFQRAGCEVIEVEIDYLTKIMPSRGAYSTGRQGHFAKDVAAQVIKHKPDFVWVHHGRIGAHPLFLQSLQRAGIPAAVYLCDEPYEVGETARYSSKFDWVFTMDPCTMETHRRGRAKRDRVFYLPPAVNPDRFKPKPWDRKTKPVFFLGNATLTPRPEWLKPIEKLVEGADIRFWEAVGKNHPKWVSLDEYPELYADTKIALNVHRDPRITKECWYRRVQGRKQNNPVPGGLKLCEGTSGFGTGFWNDANLPAAHINPRFFEMAMSGALVVSDNHRSELARMFPFAPQAESPSHFLELVHYFMNNEADAHRIASACVYRILKRHTYLHRALEVLIRLGFSESLKASPSSLLGEQGEWLTPQDFNEQGVRLSSAPTGHSERWSLASGMSQIEASGIPSDTGSLDLTTAWSP